MKPGQVYALLVEANPIPDWDALPDIGPRLQVVDTRRSTMQTQKLDAPPRETGTGGPRRLVPALAAVVAVIVAGAALVLFTGNGGESAQEARNAAAVATVQQFYAALNSGDLATIQRLTQADEADMRMWAYNVVSVDAYPREITGCQATESANSVFVEVECTVNPTNPLFVASGVTQWVEPWQVREEGELRWRPILALGFSDALRATHDYLRTEHQEAYAEVCDPSGYAFGSINFNEGIALTRECAQLVTPLADEIATWIQAGRP